MKVRDCFTTVTPEVDLVSGDARIEDVIRIISKNPASRSVYVVDADGKLAGIISVKDVLNIIGAKYLQKGSIAALREIMATSAADIMRDAEWVGPDDDLEQALKVAVMHNMEDIPVVENEKVVGNLDCFELIKGIEELHQKQDNYHAPD